MTTEQQNPNDGGSYVRQADGTLIRADQKPAPAKPKKPTEQQNKPEAK